MTAMHVLLYEFLTGGGLLSQPELSECRSLLDEGSAMTSALCADFCSLPQCRVQVLRDARLPELKVPGCDILSVSAPGEDEDHLARLCSRVDWTMIIAPETGGLLAQRCRLVEAAGGRLLGPSVEFIELAADKHRTAERLRQFGVPTPSGRMLECGERLPDDFPYPAVVKPLDGCGSQEVRLIDSASDAASYGPAAQTSRLEEFCPGVAASVSILCGPAVQHVLPPCRQLLSEDGRFNYLGGSLPLPSDLDRRARALATQTIQSFQGARGYIGVDVVLGNAEDGGQDYVIEINPRLTTSYVGLRAACRGNLAAAMLQAADGQQPGLAFRDELVCFKADGSIVPSEALFNEFPAER